MTKPDLPVGENVQIQVPTEDRIAVVGRALEDALQGDRLRAIQVFPDGDGRVVEVTAAGDDIDAGNYVQFCGDNSATPISQTRFDELHQEDTTHKFGHRPCPGTTRERVTCPVDGCIRISGHLDRGVPHTDGTGREWGLGKVRSSVSQSPTMAHLPKEPTAIGPSVQENTQAWAEYISHLRLAAESRGAALTESRAALDAAHGEIAMLQETGPENCAAKLMELEATLTESRAEVERQNVALEKINEIRSSIVGMQGFNFSEHAYPLVAALDAAGYEGLPYPEAMKNLGTLIEQRDAAEARLAEVEQEREDERFEWRKESEAGSAESRLRLHMGDHRRLEDDRQKILRDNKRLEADLIEAKRESAASDHEIEVATTARDALTERVRVLEEAIVVAKASQDRPRTEDETGDFTDPWEEAIDDLFALVPLAPTPPQGGPERWVEPIAGCPMWKCGCGVQHAYSTKFCSNCGTKRPDHPAAQGETTGEEAIARTQVIAFARLMEQKLQENDHKSGWLGIPNLDLLDMLDDEVKELRMAVIANKENQGDPSGPEVGLEAADVSNLAMMIADVFGALSPEPPTTDKESDDE